ncbi:MAG TPA: hypothetical protein VI895_01485 [Bdellovibrionota bacterium]|nr:hypothetical protein [Bdellovibrionota bacterium]
MNAPFFRTVLIVLSVTGCTHHSPAPILTQHQIADDRKPIAPVKERTDLKYGEVADRNTFERLARVADVRTYLTGVGNSLGGDWGPEALNANSFDEVADSSWFTNRNARQEVALDILRDGPPPAIHLSTVGPLAIISGKGSGDIPGFIVADPNNQRFLLKFDSSEYCGLSTSTDVISSRFLYAAGYNTRETRIEHIDPARFVLDPKAKTKDRFGKKVPMDQEAFARLIARLPGCRKDGKVRTMASRFLEGKPAGPFSYQGRRADDPNDRLPHQHRRELRGLVVLASWINNTDFQDYNTLDMFKEAGDGNGHLVHYLLDFGGSFGHGTLHPKQNYQGHIHFIDFEEAGLNLLTFGLRDPVWAQDFPIRYRSIGNFRADNFDPSEWRPSNPHPAQQQMTERDGFWGAKLVASFSDEQIRTAVRAAELPEDGAEEEMVRILKSRRDTIAKYWFSKVGALDRFVIEGDVPTVRFVDWNQAGLWRPTQAVSYRWHLRGRKIYRSGTTLKPRIELFATKEAFETWQKQIRKSADRYLRLNITPMIEDPVSLPYEKVATTARAAGHSTEASIFLHDDGRFYWVGTDRKRSSN